MLKGNTEVKYHTPNGWLTGYIKEISKGSRPIRYRIRINPEEASPRYMWFPEDSVRAAPKLELHNGGGK